MTKVALVVVEPELDERIQRMESLVGKYDNASLIDTDFTYSYQFLAMKRQVYIENYAAEGGEEAARLNIEFRGIERSTILNLRSRNAVYKILVEKSLEWITVARAGDTNTCRRYPQANEIISRRKGCLHCILDCLHESKEGGRLRLL